MKLDLSEAQWKKAAATRPIQVKYEQIGSGMSFLKMHPANVRKLEKAHRSCKGCRVVLSPEEIAEHMEGGKMSFKKGALMKHITADNVKKGFHAVDKKLKENGVNIQQVVEDNVDRALERVPISQQDKQKLKQTAKRTAKKYIDVDKSLEGGMFSFGKAIKSATTAVSKTVNRTVDKAVDGAKKNIKKGVKVVSQSAKKYVTPKNIEKYSLKGYNAINRELEKQGLESIHGAILENGLGYVPFVPQSVKSVGAHYAEKYIDKALDKRSRQVGAGLDNPYLPTQLLGSGVTRQIRTSASAVFADQSNLLRPSQAGFVGLSRQQAELLTTGQTPQLRGGSMGGSFTTADSRHY